MVPAPSIVYSSCRPCPTCDCRDVRWYCLTLPISVSSTLLVTLVFSVGDAVQSVSKEASAASDGDGVDSSSFSNPPAVSKHTLAPPLPRITGSLVSSSNIHHHSVFFFRVSTFFGGHLDRLKGDSSE